MSTIEQKRPTRAYVGLAAVLAVGCAGVGVGAYALFGDTGRATTTVEAGSVNLDWASKPAIELTISINPLTPGKTTQRLVDLHNTGSISIAELQLVHTGTPDNPATSFSDGLQLRLEKCSVPWTGTPENTTCPGETNEITADRPITGRTDIPSASAMTVGGTDHLRFTFRLPESSPDSAKTTTDTIKFMVLGNQRPGEQR